MSGGDAELSELRAGVSCALLLERDGYSLDRADSTRRCLKYRRGAGEVLIVNHEGQGWWDPMSQAKGDVFTLAQHLEPGLNFGQVRKLLRGMVGMAPSYPAAERLRELEEPIVPPGERWAGRRRLCQGSASWAYLTVTRALPPVILQATDLFDAVREGPRSSAWFAHRSHQAHGDRKSRHGDRLGRAGPRVRVRLPWPDHAMPVKRTRPALDTRRRPPWLLWLADGRQQPCGTHLQVDHLGSARPAAPRLAWRVRRPGAPGGSRRHRHR